MPNIIIHGNPVDGLQFIGPFPDGKEIGEEFTEPLNEWWIATLNPPVGYVPADSTCRHCGREIVKVDGAWIDPEATGDDAMWRETCAVALIHQPPLP